MSVVSCQGSGVRGQGSDRTRRRVVARFPGRSPRPTTIPAAITISQRVSRGNRDPGPCDRNGSSPPPRRGSHNIAQGKAPRRQPQSAAPGSLIGILPQRRFVPSPQYSGERARVRGQCREGSSARVTSKSPLIRPSATFSPEYRGEGTEQTRRIHSEKS